MTIQRYTPELSGVSVVSSWFIPVSMIGMDEDVIKGIAAMGWGNTVRCYRAHKLPGGTFVDVATFAGEEGLTDFALEFHRAFAECVDFVLGTWNPQDPFVSRNQLLEEVAERWIKTIVVIAVRANRH